MASTLPEVGVTIARCFTMSSATGWLLSEGLSDDISRYILKNGIHVVIMQRRNNYYDLCLLVDGESR